MASLIHGMALLLPDRLCCSLPTSSTHTGHGMRSSALDTLRVLVVTGSKVILDLLLAEDNTQQLCQLLSWGNQGNILTSLGNKVAFNPCGKPSNRVSLKISLLLTFVYFSTPEIRTPLAPYFNQDTSLITSL